MVDDGRGQSRREFLGRLGEVGAASALAGGAAAPALAQSPAQVPAGAWDLTWVERVRRAAHRAVFDAPTRDLVLMLAARYLDNVRTVYGAGVGAGDVCAVLNLRTRAISLALGDAAWQKYPVAEDYKVNDPLTSAPARRNVDWRPAAGASGPEADATLERVQQRGAVVLVCDFALGHLATRLAKQAGSSADAVHAELRAGLIPGAVLVPSGIWGAAQAQNAGCAFIPA